MQNDVAPLVMSRIIMALLLCFAAGIADGQQDWKLRKDADGIKIYTINTPNSNFKSVKVDLTVNATVSQLVAFLMDIDRQKEWIYNTRASHLVRMIRANEFIFYSEVDVPWPCVDRDYIAHLTIQQLSPQLTVIDSRADPDMLPVKDGMIRVRTSNAHWEITPMGNDVQHIVYTLRFDPGGSIPAWLTNMFVTKAPTYTFQNLREKVKDARYRNAHFDFIKS